VAVEPVVAILGAGLAVEEELDGIAVEAGEAVASSAPAWPCSPSRRWPYFLAVLFLDVVAGGGGSGRRGGAGRRGGEGRAGLAGLDARQLSPVTSKDGID
jgi:hypothetical protein